MRSIAQPRARRVSAGDLTELISFEVESRVDDGHGGKLRSWGHAFEAYAAVEPIYVGEREDIGAVRNVVQYRFTIYRTDAVTEQMRIRFDGTTHAIKGFRREGVQKMFMEIITETGLGD